MILTLFLYLNLSMASSFVSTAPLVPLHQTSSYHHKKMFVSTHLILEGNKIIFTFENSTQLPLTSSVYNITCSLLSVNQILSLYLLDTSTNTTQTLIPKLSSHPKQITLNLNTSNYTFYTISDLDNNDIFNPKLVVESTSN